jgi:uncharacterized protein YcgI (DUF1989 family)
MTTQTDSYTYRLNGHDGTFDLVEIVNPEGKAIASLYYWNDRTSDEEARAMSSARTICRHLNRWQIGNDPEA